MKILLVSNKQYILVDDEDYEKLCKLKWSSIENSNGTWYAKNGKIKLHRYVLGITNPKIDVRHIDGDYKNNQKHNLRICSKSQTSCGRSSSKNKNNPFLGVNLDKRTGKFRAEIRKYGKNHYLGSFNTAEDAAKAYDKKAIELHGEKFANINFKNPVIQERSLFDLPKLYLEQINKGFEEEFWKPCPGWEQYYNISNFGRTYNIKKEKLCSIYSDKDGYTIVHLMITYSPFNFKKFQMKMHRAVAIAFIPNPENKPQVNHKDGIKTNNNIDNLEWVTGSENQKHALQIGLIKQGEDVHNASLTNNEVIKIRKLKGKKSGVELAKQFNTSENVISEVIRGKTYKNI